MKAGPVKTGFGLDLAGYSTCGTSLARATRDDSGNITVTIYQDTCFAEQTDGPDLLAEVNEAEVNAIRKCCSAGVLVVDVPIDLQGLPMPKSPEFVWQLVQRPVDRAFNALRPLADKIGAYVARMQRLWHLLRCNKDDPLDTTLFETYPAACLELLDVEAVDYRKGYKGNASFDGKRWKADRTKSSKQEKRNKKFASILNEWGWTGSRHMSLSHDEFDAAICALVGIADSSELLCGSCLTDEITDKLRHKKAVPENCKIEFKAPLGYRLLKKRLAPICIDVGIFADVGF